MKVTNSLLVIYKEKDRDFFKHLKELVDSYDDTQDSIIGTEDGTVKVIRCEEKKWLEWTKRDNDFISRMADKFIFIDLIKYMDYEVPVYNQYGVSFGRLDDRVFSISVDDDYEWTDYLYQAFSKELQELTDKEIAEINAYEKLKKSKKKTTEKAALAFAAFALFPPAVPFAGGAIAVDANELAKNKQLLREQMLYFAISKAYYEGLEEFMKN